jgi:hypothetical protein
MPVILVLLVVAFVAHFFWVLAAFAAAAVVGRVIGGWLARRDDRAAGAPAGSNGWLIGLTGSTPRSSPGTNWSACTGNTRLPYSARYVVGTLAAI